MDHLNSLSIVTGRLQTNIIRIINIFNKIFFIKTPTFLQCGIEGVFGVTQFCNQSDVPILMGGMPMSESKKTLNTTSNKMGCLDKTIAISVLITVIVLYDEKLDLFETTFNHSKSNYYKGIQKVYVRLDDTSLSCRKVSTCEMRPLLLLTHHRFCVSTLFLADLSSVPSL